MSSSEERIKLILKRVEELKATIESLENERQGFTNKITQLETELKHEREKDISKMSVDKEEIKKELGRHIEEIDECLNLLKTV